MTTAINMNNQHELRINSSQRRKKSKWIACAVTKSNDPLGLRKRLS